MKSICRNYLDDGASKYRMAVFKLDISNRNYVYALLCRDGDGPGYIKFGRSERIGDRLSSLRMACPIPARYFAIMEVPSLPMAKKVERELHKHFEERKTKGEWFRFDFDSKQDKRDFNDGCVGVFSKFLNPPHSWTKISVKELDAYNAARKAAFIHSKNAKSVMEKAARDEKRRAAWVELSKYGT